MLPFPMQAEKGEIASRRASRYMNHAMPVAGIGLEVEMGALLPAPSRMLLPQQAMLQSSTALVEGPDAVPGRPGAMLPIRASSAPRLTEVEIATTECVEIWPNSVFSSPESTGGQAEP
jgi:hypothetical protein